jgi:hypothetical protein
MSWDRTNRSRQQPYDYLPEPRAPLPPPRPAPNFPSNPHQQIAYSSHRPSGLPPPAPFFHHHHQQQSYPDQQHYPQQQQQQPYRSQPVGGGWSMSTRKPSPPLTLPSRVPAPVDDDPGWNRFRRGASSVLPPPSSLPPVRLNPSAQQPIPQHPSSSSSNQKLDRWNLPVSSSSLPPRRYDLPPRQPSPPPAPRNQRVNSPSGSGWEHPSQQQQPYPSHPRAAGFPQRPLDNHSLLSRVNLPPSGPGAYRGQGGGYVPKAGPSQEESDRERLDEARRVFESGKGGRGGKRVARNPHDAVDKE